MLPRQPATLPSVVRSHAAPTRAATSPSGTTRDSWLTAWRTGRTGHHASSTFQRASPDGSLKSVRTDSECCDLEEMTLPQIKRGSGEWQGAQKLCDVNLIALV